MASVVGLGYIVIGSTDLPAWEEFGSGLLGLQVAERTDQRLLLRMDEKSYRLDVRHSDENKVLAIGWETNGAAELQELSESLESAGYVVKACGREEAHERKVTGLARLTDPDGLELELFYGLQKDKNRFVSPTGARFKTGTGGLGHIFQTVRNEAAFEHLYSELFGFRLSDHIEFGPTIQGVFLHCNTRHHSFAYADIPNLPVGILHMMVEVDDIDFVGRAWDRVQDGAAPVAATLGRHSNDEMISFYVSSPSGLQVEYGFGGLDVDDATWRPTRYDVPSYWGHKMINPNEPAI
jgi:2,3-dihydroxybiphenyl 1,2-dioxygenase